ncbi:MAG: MMPL family transporter, partial [Actinomycetota bacterium]
MFPYLASLATRRGRTVVLFSVIAFIAAGALGAGVADRLEPYGADDPDTESVVADDRLEDAGYHETGAIVLFEDVDVGTREGRERVQRYARLIEDEPEVAEVASFYSTGSRSFVSRDGDATYLGVRFTTMDDDAEQDAATRIVDELKGKPGITVGGGAVAREQVNTQVEEDLRTAELYAVPLLFLLSLLFFRSLVAALLPLLVGALTIVSTFLMLTVASELTSVSIFALNLVTGLGLGLAIDYSLFMVSRYREEIARSGPGLEAMRRTMATAGRTVLFSSLTVAGALAGLLVFPQRFL